MKNSIFSFLYFFTIITLSTQKMNAAECMQCMVLRNDLLASLLEQTRLTNKNLEFAQTNLILLNENKKMIQRFDALADLNKQLANALSNVLRIHAGISTKKFILSKNHTIEYKGFYFTDDRHKFIYQHTPSQNSSFTS